MAEPPLHAEVEPLGFLLGTWTGQGHGHYPTIAPFDYGEEWRFWHTGKPFLAYAQRSWALDDGRPLAAEVGYWRLKGGRLEVVLAHPTGVAEVEEGTLARTPSGASVRLATTGVLLAATAKRVDRLERAIDVDGDALDYAVALAAVGEPLQEHLVARLRRGPRRDGSGGKGG